MALDDIQAETVAEAPTRFVGLMAVYTSKQLGIGLEKYRWRLAVYENCGTVNTLVWQPLTLNVDETDTVVGTVHQFCIQTSSSCMCTKRTKCG
jgi:hypothetical protein